MMEREELLGLGIEEDICDKIMEEFSKIEEECERKISDVKKDSEIEIALYESGAKNIKAVRALIDKDGDISKQLEMLKKESDTSFLFESERRSFKPGMSSMKLPDTKTSDFEARLSKARKNGNTIEAIKIKKQAAQAGIMLL